MTKRTKKALNKVTKEIAAVAEDIREAVKAEPTTPEPRKERQPRVDASASTRALLLKLLADAGLRAAATKTGAWHKVEGKEKRRVYVQARGPQVHLSRFSMRGHLIEQLTEEQAKARHLGSVRGIFFMDRNNDSAVRAFAKDLVAELK